MKIIINASDVASISGYNPYVTEKEILEKILLKNSFLNPSIKVKKINSYTEEKLSKLIPEEMIKIANDLNINITQVPTTILSILQ